MTVTPLLDPRIHALRARLRDLHALQRRVAEEIALTKVQIDDAGGRRRGEQPPCGTERGYQWHRRKDITNWPLSVDDPCGCRAAHAAHWRMKHGRAA